MKGDHKSVTDAFRLPPYPEVLRALSYLLEAFKESQENNQSPWEYAVELPNFLNAGLPTFHLRWLMDKGIVEHGYERVRGSSIQRHFRRVNAHVFNETSCFVLKAEAVAKVREALVDASLGPAEGSGPQGNHFLFEVPVWNKATGQLWYENDLVKVVPATALNQRAVLDGGQANDWRQPIANPFRGSDNRCLPEPLHNALERLNGKQINRRLHFFRDGSGKSFRWKPLNPDESGPHPGGFGIESRPQLERKRPSRP